MNLIMDIGNTQIHGGIFKEGDLLLEFHKRTEENISADELGLFLTAMLRENGFDPQKVSGIGVCSVVPDLNPVTSRCCRRYFGRAPFFLQAGVKVGLKIRYSQPREVGTDRIANAIAACEMYPHRNIIVVDFGTATTICGIAAGKEYLGGALLPGLKITMEALAKRTARLPEVEIARPRRVCGKATEEGIQAGLYYGNLGMVKELKNRMIRELFADQEAVTVATGTWADLYADEGIFDTIVPDLVLRGVHSALLMNQ